MNLNGWRNLESGKKIEILREIVHLGKLKLAREMLLEMLGDGDLTVKEQLLVSELLYDLKDYRSASYGIKKVTILNPDFELASVFLFHSLLRDGRSEEAYAEMRRFIEDYPENLSEYPRLLDEMTEALDVESSD